MFGLVLCSFVSNGNIVITGLIIEHQISYLNIMMIVSVYLIMIYIEFLGSDAVVLLHAEVTECRDGESKGKKGVSDLRQDVVRQIYLEPTHEDPHRLDSNGKWTGYQA